MTLVSSHPSEIGFPSGDEIADGYERVIQVARDRLDRPWSCRIRTWEDGEIEIRVWHKYGWRGLDGSIRGVIRWHSEEDDIKAGLFETEPGANGEKELIEQWTIHAGRGSSE